MNVSQDPSLLRSRGVYARDERERERERTARAFYFPSSPSSRSAFTLGEGIFSSVRVAQCFQPVRLAAIMAAAWLWDERWACEDIYGEIRRLNFWHAARIAALRAGRPPAPQPGRLCHIHTHIHSRIRKILNPNSNTNTRV